MPLLTDLTGKEGQICQEYLSGCSREFLRTKYHCHFRNITRLLKAKQITLRTPSEAKQIYDINQNYYIKSI